MRKTAPSPSTAAAAAAQRRRPSASRRPGRRVQPGRWSRSSGTPGERGRPRGVRRHPRRERVRGVDHGVPRRCSRSQRRARPTPPNPPTRTSPAAAAGRPTRPASELTTDRRRPGAARAARLPVPPSSSTGLTVPPTGIRSSGASGRVQVAVREAASAASTRPTTITAVRRMPAAATCSAMSARRPAQHHLVRPAGVGHHRDRAVRAVVRRPARRPRSRSAARPGAAPGSRGWRPDACQVLPRRHRRWPRSTVRVRITRLRRPPARSARAAATPPRPRTPARRA